MLLDAFIEMAQASPVLRLDEPPPPQPTREELARQAARRQALSVTTPIDVHNGDPALYAQHPLGPNPHAPPPVTPQSQTIYTNGASTNGKRKRRRIAQVRVCALIVLYSSSSYFRLQDDTDPEEAARRSSNMAFITEIIQPHER